MESHPRVPIDKNMTLKNAQIIKKQNVWRFVRHNNKITIAARRQTMRARMCQISAKNCGASLKEMSNQIYWLSLFVRNGGSDSSWRPGLIEMWKANDRGRRANNVHLFFFFCYYSLSQDPRSGFYSWHLSICPAHFPLQIRVCARLKRRLARLNAFHPILPPQFRIPWDNQWSFLLAPPAKLQITRWEI